MKSEEKLNDMEAAKCSLSTVVATTYHFNVYMYFFCGEQGEKTKVACM
jgi:hypothetical protein